MDEVKSKVKPEFKGSQLRPASERFDFGLKTLVSPPDLLTAPGDNVEKPGLWRQRGVVDIKKAPEAAQVADRNITNPVPANHWPVGWGGGGAYSLNSWS